MNQQKQGPVDISKMWNFRQPYEDETYINEPQEYRRVDVNKHATSPIPHPKRPNRLHDLLRLSPRSLKCRSPNPGKLPRKNLQMIGRHSITNDGEDMEFPLLPSQQMVDTARSPTTINDSVDRSFDNHFEEISKEHMVTMECGEDLQRHNCSNLNTDWFRPGQDFTATAQVVPSIVQVMPKKSCLKPQIAQAGPSPTCFPMPTLKSCLKPPNEKYIPLKPMEVITIVKKTAKISAATRAPKTPKGHAAQLNVKTGLVEYLHLYPSHVVSTEKSIPELTVCTQLCIPKSATASVPPKSFSELDVRFVRVNMMQPAA